MDDQPTIGAPMHPVTKVISAAMIAGAMITGSAATALAEPSEDSPSWDCRYHGNKECGPGAELPDGSRVGPEGYNLDWDRYNATMARMQANDQARQKQSTTSTKSSQRSSSSSKATTNGMWPTLDNAIKAGDRSAIKRAITDKGQSATYHDRVVAKVRQAHPELAQRYGF